MSKRIVLAVTNDLATDQRVDRSCISLVEAGYDVVLVGRKLPESPKLDPRPYTMQRMRLVFRRSALFYAEYNFRLFVKLLFVRADAFFANDTDTLLACRMAAAVRRKKLFFDAHELFPEVPELVDKPRVRAVWRHIEEKCLPHVDAAFTVCQSVADEYYARYGVTMTVVRNLAMRFSDNQKIDKETSTTPTLLYQGAVNVGRGVREAIDAMQYLPKCRLVVAGDGDLLPELREYASHLEWADRVCFLGRVRPEELHAITSKASLGLCLLEDLGLNYRYALPNRVGDFAQAGVPLLATDFPEIRRIFDSYGIGTLTEACPKVKSGKMYEKYVTELADTIRKTLDFWNDMPAQERAQRFQRAGEELCWEKEKSIFVEKLTQYF